MISEIAGNIGHAFNKFCHFRLRPQWNVSEFHRNCVKIAEVK